MENACGEWEILIRYIGSGLHALVPSECNLTCVNLFA